MIYMNHFYRMRNVLLLLYFQLIYISLLFDVLSSQIQTSKGAYKKLKECESEQVKITGGLESDLNSCPPQYHWNF